MVTFFLALFLHPLSTFAGDFLVDSHLKEFDLSAVQASVAAGANMVEIDLWQADPIALNPVLAFLDVQSGLRLVLHWKGNVPVDLEPVAAILEPHQASWNRLLFYSSDAAFNERMRRRFPGIYITRSTRDAVLACLNNGLEDEDIFRANCLQADLWPPYDQFLAPGNPKREATLALVRKIRAFESSQGGAASWIAVDQINSEAAACDFLRNFAGVDGLITENISAISGLLRQGKMACEF
jgi:hypothetical protein